MANIINNQIKFKNPLNNKKLTRIIEQLKKYENIYNVNTNHINKITFVNQWHNTLNLLQKIHQKWPNINFVYQWFYQDDIELINKQNPDSDYIEHWNKVEFNKQNLNTTPSIHKKDVMHEM